MFLVIVLIGWLISCDSDDDAIVVDEDLQEYFDRFALEAIERGIKVAYDSIPISARITVIDQNNIAGTCTRRDHDNNDIEVNRAFWERATDLEREFVVFHELGHCYLDREHTEVQHSDGTCSSIMASGTGTCRNNYTINTRDDYIDELFGL